MTIHDADKLLWTFGPDISRFVNTLSDAHGVTVYDAETIADISPSDDGFATVGVCLYDEGGAFVTAALQLNPATGELREAF